MPWDASRAVITQTLFLPRKLEEARHATHFWEARELFITRITLFTHITARCNTAITPSRILSVCILGTLSEYLLSRSSTDLTTFANQHLRLPSFFQASFPIYSCLCVCSLCFVLAVGKFLFGMYLMQERGAHAICRSFASSHFVVTDRC